MSEEQSPSTVLCKCGHEAHRHLLGERCRAPFCDCTYYRSTANQAPDLCACGHRRTRHTKTGGRCQNKATCACLRYQDHRQAELFEGRK